MKSAVIAALAANLSLLSASPAGFWRFDDVPGFIADSSENHRSLDIHGGVTSLASGGPAAGQAAAFSGTGRLIAADDPTWHSQKFTIEATFRANAVAIGRTQVIVSHHNNDDNHRGWHLAEAGGKLRFAKSANGSSLNSIDLFTLAANRDYYAAAILDADAGWVRLVLKDLTGGTGVQTELRSIPINTFDANAPLSIGATGTVSGGTSFFTGIIDDVRFSPSALDTEELLHPFVLPPPQFPGNPVVRTKADGYKGIWFALGQTSTYGDKYSGGLGTYTTNHRPIAVHAPEVNKTFFTYGGTSGPNDKYLLIMAGEYDHASHTVKKPTVVMDKNGVDDPHDNGCITIDKDGYLWVFVSGRSGQRKGFTYRSAEPYSVDGFSRVSPASGETYTYPQIWYDPARGFFHLFTIYNGSQRELFFRTSPDGIAWSANRALAKIQGHYQVSGRHGNKIATFFNRHPGGNVDARTDLYYLQSTDWGATWTTADGTPAAVPLTTPDNPARVFNYSAINRLMYGIDIAFDAAGHPVLLYLTAANFRPGPGGEPRTVHTARWTGESWDIRDLPPSATASSTTSHNYDTGSIWIEDGTWTVMISSGSDPDLQTANTRRFWGHGGEVEKWLSTDQGLTWTRDRTVTESSPRNHGYIRKSQDGAGKFAAFWADGNPETMTESHLYFGNREGTRFWELPYEMSTGTAHPVEVNPPYLRWRKSHFEPHEMNQPDISGDNADPDHDGLPNLLEYAMGTDPRVPDGFTGLIAGLMADATGPYLSLRHQLNTEAFDILHAIESSEDLVTWTDAGPGLFDISASGESKIRHIEQGDRSISADPPASRRFYRMKYWLDR